MRKSSSRSPSIDIHTCSNVHNYVPLASQKLLLNTIAGSISYHKISLQYLTHHKSLMTCVWQ